LSATFYLIALARAGAPEIAVDLGHGGCRGWRETLDTSTRPTYDIMSITSARNPSSPCRTIAYELNGNCYLNVTNRCTLRCAFCPKFNGQWDVQSYGMRLRRDPTSAELVQAVGDPRRYRQVVFCGLGEPTLRWGTLIQTADWLRTRGASVRVNTDGLANLVHDCDVTAQLRGCVDALSISLNAQDEATYSRHCRPSRQGSYAAMLDFTARARDQVEQVTVTAIDGLEGVDIDACAAIADRLGVAFRRRVLDQVG